MMEMDVTELPQLPLRPARRRSALQFNGGGTMNYLVESLRPLQDKISESRPTWAL